jgi:uncharacterized protein
MSEALGGFDWDAGNRAECQKHGVSLADIEALFSRPLLIVPDTGHSKLETRIPALGKTSAGRMIFLVLRYGGKPECG